MEFSTRDSTMWDGVLDILMHIGSDNYDVPQILHEGTYWGISKRIPMQSVPDGVVPYFSELLGWHSQAIPFVMADNLSLVDLVAELIERGLLSEELASEDWDWQPEPPLIPADYVPDFTLAVTCAIQKDHKQWSELQEKYKIQWQGGVIFRTVLGKVEYVCKEGEESLPDEIANDSRYKAVKVKYYKDKDGNVLDNTVHPEWDGPVEGDGEDV